MNRLAEHRESLWMLAASPMIWAVHFLASYVTAAIWCAKVGGSLDSVRLVIGGLTLAALLGIGWIAVVGLRRSLFGMEGSVFRGRTTLHDFDSPEDRHRFLGFAALLLSGLSFVAVIYVALTAVFVERCI